MSEAIHLLNQAQLRTDDAGLNYYRMELKDFLRLKEVLSAPPVKAKPVKSQTKDDV